MLPLTFSDFYSNFQREEGVFQILMRNIRRANKANLYKMEVEHGERRREERTKITYITHSPSNYFSLKMNFLLD
jgi:hypothetical protein